MNAPVTVTASFQALPTTTIQSVPAGLTFTVDNVACVSPCLMQWIPGSSHAIVAGTQIMGSNTQYVFASWNQGNAAAQTVTAPAANFTYTATFTAQYAVSAYVGPSAGGNITLDPPGGWYAPGTPVKVGAAVNPGWAFTGFSGAVNSAVAPQVFTVNAPVTVTANFTPDFALSIPTPITTQINGSAQFTVTVTGQNGFSDSVTFDAPVLPTGATATFNPPTIYGSGTSTVTITAPSTGGTFAFTLRGTAGAASSGLTHGVAGSLAVQDFTVTPLTPTPTAGVGDTLQYAFAIGGLGGFNGNVSVALYQVSAYASSPSQPPNSHCNIGGAPSQQYSAGVVTLTFTINPYICDAWPEYDVALTFSSGTIIHNLTVQFVGVTSGVFSLSTPSPAPIASGGFVTLPIHVATNFPNKGYYVIFNPSLIVVPCGLVSSPPAATVTAPGDTSLTVNTAGCPPGTMTALVTGQALGAIQTIAIPYVVGTAAPPDFSLQPTPSSRTIAPGASDLYTLNVASINGFNQTVSIVPGTLPSGVTATFPAGSSVNGSGTVSLRLAVGTTAASGTYTIAVTGTAAGLLPRSTTLTLNIPAPPPQSGVTLGTIPHTTIPADGTVVSVAVPVTYLGSGTLTLRSTSHLPKGMNVKFSGLTLMVSAANGVDPDTYCVDYEFDDGAGGDGSAEDCSIIVGPPGGGGGGMPPTVPAPVIDTVTSPDGHQPATAIAGVPSRITIQGRNFGATPTNLVYYLNGWSPTNPSAPFWPPNAVSASYSIVSWSDTSINADITLPAVASGLWRIQVGFHGYISDYDATHPSTGLLQVFDATPQITGLDQTQPIPGGQIAVTINGTGFGSAGTVAVCALVSSSGPCTQTADITVPPGLVIWGTTISAVLIPQVATLGPAYCVQVQSRGASGTSFVGAPNGASTASGNCFSLNMSTVTLTPSDVSGNPGDVFTFTAAGSGSGTYNWSIAGEDASVFQFVSSSCTSGTTCSAVVPDSCTGAQTCTVYVQAKSAGFANVGVAFQAGSAIPLPKWARVRAITVQITKIWSDQFPDGPVANYLPDDGMPGTGAGAGLVGDARRLLIAGVRDSRNGDAFPLSGWKGYIKGLVTTSPAGSEALNHILVRVAQGIPLTAPTAGSWATAGLNTPPGGVGGVDSSGVFSVAIEQQLTATDYTVVAGVNRNATMNQVVDTLTPSQASTWFYLPCPVIPASHGACSNGAVRIISLAENIFYEAGAMTGAFFALPAFPTAADHLRAFVTGQAPFLALPAPTSSNSSINTAELLFNIGLMFATGTSPYGGPIYEYQYANTSEHAGLIRADSDFQSLIFETVALHKAEVLGHFSGLPAGSNFTFPAWQAIGCSSALKAGYVGPCPAGGNTYFDDTPASTADFPALFPCSAGPGSLPPGVTSQSLSGKECDLTFSTSTNLNYAFGRVGYNFRVIANVTSVDSSRFLVNSVSLVGYLYDSYQWNPAIDAFLDKHLSNIQAGSNAADRVGQVFRIKVTLDTQSPIILSYAF